MAINKGNIKTSVNYNLEAQKPLDARSVRPTKADLYKKESWSYDGDSVYIYNGMLVYVEDEKKTYCLVDETKYNTESGWELVGTGASSGGGSDITVDSAMSDSSTNPVQNRVVKKYVDDAINSIPPQEPTVDVIDNLDSTDTEAALSANQGRILNEKIEAVASEATKIFNVKGSCKYAELPTTNNAVGDVYNITDSFTIGSESYPAGTNVVWDGKTWDALGGSIDLSAYATTETVVAMVQEETDRAKRTEINILSDVITVKANVAKKVDKEDGKGLSDENFTSALKKKLEELVNYKDEDIRNDIASLQSQLDTLTNSDDLEEVIAKYEELKAFLEGLDNDEYGAFVEEISKRIATLEASLKTTNSRIDNVTEEVERLEVDKQNVLTSGVDIVTINNESILRKGNLDLATTQYVDDAIAGIEGGGGGNANVLVINSDADFNLREGLNTTGGIINDKNITYAKVQEAIENGYTIALKEPSGNISYCIKADYAVPNQNGEKRIMIFFSWRVGDEEYAATLYVGLDSSLTYMKWKLDLATKDYVDGAIEDIPSGGGGSSVEVVDSLDSEDTTAALSANQGRVLKEMIEEGITEEKEVYIGSDEPSEAKLWIDPTGTPSGGNGGNSGGESASGLNIFYIPEGVYTATKDSPYLFSPEECSAFLDILTVDNVIYATKHFYSYAVGPYKGMLLTRDMRPSEVGPFDLLYSGQSVYDMSDTGLIMVVHTYTISLIDENTVQGYYKFYSYSTGIN